MNTFPKRRLKQGWAHGDITPQQKTFVQGQFHARISDQVVSPLTATVLALEGLDSKGQSEQAVLISCDLPQDFFKPELLLALKDRCPGLDPHKCTIHATHTHNAPCTISGWYEAPEDDPDFMHPEAYRAWLVAQVADLVEQAWTNRQNGSLSRGFSYAVVGRCRRAVYDNGDALMYGDSEHPDFRGFEACDDHAIHLLFLYDSSAQLAGIVVNVACPAQCEEHAVYFSADFWHEVRENVIKQYGPDVHVLAQCGAAGDMSPHLLSYKTEEADLRNRLGVDSKSIIARRICAAIAEGMESASPPEQDIIFEHRIARWKVDRLKVTRDEYELEKHIHTMSEEERKKQHYAFQKLWPFGPVCELISRYEQQGDHPTHDVESHIIRIGDAVIATNPFELFVDYGHQIRCRSQALQTFVVQLGDDSGNGFYLPTQKAIEGGHYSAQVKSCWVGPKGGQQLVDNTVNAINALFKDANYPKTR